MENKDPESWSSAHIYQSQWLQTTISDLDEKLKAMMTTLEGSHSPKQGHMHCKWREDLICMLEEFGQSYRVLALAYNQLKSKTSDSTSHSHSGSLSSSSTSKTISDFKLFNKQEGEYHLLSAESCNMKFKPELECRDTQIEERITDFSTNGNDSIKIDDSELNLEGSTMIDFKCDNTWSVLKYKITKLTEDNLNQFIELARRNDEKRDTIRRLQLEVEALKRENKALQISLRSSGVDSEYDLPRMSKSGGRTMGKLFRGCSP